MWGRVMVKQTPSKQNQIELEWVPYFHLTKNNESEREKNNNNIK